jgi:hypothetical protein
MNTETRKKKERAEKEVKKYETADKLFNPDGSLRPNIVKPILDFQRLPKEEQQAIKDEWNDYYEKVTYTPAYKRFILQKEAMKNGDLAKVKDIAIEARKALKEGKTHIPKPRGLDYETVVMDPDWLRYLYFKRVVKNINEEEGLDPYDAAKEIFNGNGS